MLIKFFFVTDEYLALNFYSKKNHNNATIVEDY